MVVSIDSRHGVDKVGQPLPSVVGGTIAKPTNQELVAREVIGRVSGEQAAIDNAVDSVLTGSDLVAIDDEGVRDETRDMKGVMESARREAGELVVVVLEDGINAVRAMSGFVPLGSSLTAEAAALFLNNEDALARQEGE